MLLFKPLVPDQASMECTIAAKHGEPGDRVRQLASVLFFDLVPGLDNQFR